MKRFLLTILVLIIFGAVAVVTCPDKQAHKDAIMNVLNEKMNEELNSSGAAEDELAVLFGSIGTGFMERVIDNRLMVTNHFFWSVGEIQKLDGEKYQASLGLFGHVFTFKKEDLDEQLSKAK